MNDILSWLVFGAIIAIGIIGYYIGVSVGQEEGFNRGYATGHRQGQRKWADAMEQRRGPDGKDALVRVFRPIETHLTNHTPGYCTTSLDHADDPNNGRLVSVHCPQHQHLPPGTVAVLGSSPATVKQTGGGWR